MLTIYGPTSVLQPIHHQQSQNEYRLQSIAGIRHGFTRNATMPYRTGSLSSISAFAHVLYNVIYVYYKSNSSYILHSA